MTKQDEPLPSVENENGDEKQSIWASILRDVKSSTKKAPATKSLVVLGDNESGRTTLVAKLQGNDDPKRGAGLEYHYIDVKDDDRDDTPKLGVWILDGDVACSAPLLKFAIKPDSVENSLLILVASMTQPWSLLKTLKKWVSLVDEHLERLQLDPTRLREMRDRLQYDFQHYIEPIETSMIMSSSSTTIKSGVGGGRVPSSVSSVSLASTTPLSPNNGDEQVVLPLGEGVLTKSLGIPVIVVITKCDVMPTLEKENDYKDEQFDFMQHHLRKFCLEYGAALFYTSVKEKKNIDKLYKYIVHKCYGYPFSSPAAIVEREAIFIPAGWDNPKKADILLENLHRLKSTDIYSDVFVKPIVRRPLQRDTEVITAEDDQEFLSRLQLTLNRAASPGRTDESGTPVLTRNAMPTGVSGGIGAQTPSMAARPRNQQNATPVGANTSANEGALANFFNSLLTRKSGGAVTPTAVGTPVTQRQTSLLSSPTTPSSKRLPQHPLTFAVTPPVRTKTPTSLRTFPPAIAVEPPPPPPKVLSPVAEQQVKAAASPTTFQAVFQDMESTAHSSDNQENEPITSNEQRAQSPNERRFDGETIQFDSEKTETDDAAVPVDKASAIVPSPVMESQVPLNETQKQENEVPRLYSPRSASVDLPNNENEKSPVVQSKPSSPSLSDSELRTVPEQQSSSTVSNQTPFEPIHTELINEHKTESSSSPIRSRPSSPSIDNSEQKEDHSLSMKSETAAQSSENAHLLTDDVARSTSPTARSPSNFENPSQDQNDKHRSSLVTNGGEIAPLPSSPSPVLSASSNSSLHEEEESHAVVDSSRRDSVTNSPTRSRSLSPVSNGQQQREDGLTPTHADNASTAHPSSPGARESESPIRSRPTSPSVFDIPEALSIEKEQNSQSPFYPNKHNESFSAEQSEAISTEKQRSRSPSPVSDVPTTNERKFSESNMPSSPSYRESDTEADSKMPLTTVSYEENSHPQASSPVRDNESASNTSHSVLPVNDERRRSSATPSAKDRSRSNSLQQEENFESSEKFDKQSSHETFIEKHESLRSSVSEKSRSPSPENSGREESTIPAQENYEINLIEKVASPPTSEEKQQRDRSPSPTRTSQREGSSSPVITIPASPSTKFDLPSASLWSNPETSESRSSPTHENQEARRQSVEKIASSPITEPEQRHSRSPSPLAETRRRDSADRPESPSAMAASPQFSNSDKNGNPESRINKENIASSPVTEQAPHQRSRSPSPIHDGLRRESSPLLTEMPQSPSPKALISPIIPQPNSEGPEIPHSPTQIDREITRQSSENIASSPVTETQQQRSRSPSPLTETERRDSSAKSVLTSPTHAEASENHQGKDEQKQQQRSRSPSPVEETRRRDSTQAPRSISKENTASSPAIEQKLQERSRSPSPIQNQDSRRRTSSPKTPISPVTLQPKSEGHEIPHSPTLFDRDITRKSSENIASSPVTETQQQRSRSPSPLTETERQDSSAKAVLTSPTHAEANENHQGKDEQTQQQRSRSPSPVEETKRRDSIEEPRPISNENTASSPAVEQKSQELSRSPSPIEDQEILRTSSPKTSISPITPQPKSEGHEIPHSPTQIDREITSQSSENIASSPVTETQQQRSRSPSPLTETERRDSSAKSVPTSPTHAEANENHQGKDEQKQQQRSRSPSPVEETRRRDSTQAPRSISKENTASSPAIEQKSQELSRSPSPIQDQEILRRTSSHKTPISPFTPQPNSEGDEIPHSPTQIDREITSQSSENIASSPMSESKELRSRSPSLLAETERRDSSTKSVPTSPTHAEASENHQGKDEQKQQQRSRSPSPVEEIRPRDSTEPLESPSSKTAIAQLYNSEENEESSELPISNENTASSPAVEQKSQERSRSPSPIQNQDSRRRASSPKTPISPVTPQPNSEGHEIPHSPTLFDREITRQSSENIASSPMSESKELRSRSPSPLAETSPDSIANSELITSPTLMPNAEANESLPATKDEKHQQRRSSRSPSPIHESPRRDSFPLVTDAPRSPSPKAAISPTALQSDSDGSTTHRSPTQENHEIRRDATELDTSSSVHNNPPSPTQESSRRDSSFETIDMVGSLSPKSPSSPRSETGNSEGRKSPRSPIVEQKQEQRSRSPSPVRDDHHEKNILLTPSLQQHESQLSPNQEQNAEIPNENRRNSSVNEGQDRKSRSPSPRTSKQEQEFSSFDQYDLTKSSPVENLWSPITQREPSFTKETNETKTSSSPASPVNETVPSTHSEKQRSPSPLATNAGEQSASPIYEQTIGSNPPYPSAYSEISRRSPSTHRSSFDYPHGFPSAPSLPSAVRRSSIPRSHSQRSLIRPTTLHFSPKNPDFDGPYTTNQYNDKDHAIENDEHHHTSAPSTVSVEYRRPSLLSEHKFDEQQPTLIDPIEITKRLSMIEKPRIEDVDGTPVDSASTNNSKST